MIVIQYWIKCDQCDRMEFINQTSYTNGVIAEIRHAARRMGWRKKKEGIKYIDICNNCRKKEKTDE